MPIYLPMNTQAHSIPAQQDAALQAALNQGGRVAFYVALHGMMCSICALDYESERIIQENMRSMWRGWTGFVIAHRLMAVREADRIPGPEGGALVEQGAHAELRARSARYAQLYRHQVA